MAQVAGKRVNALVNFHIRHEKCKALAIAAVRNIKLQYITYRVKRICRDKSKHTLQL